MRTQTTVERLHSLLVEASKICGEISAEADSKCKKVLWYGIDNAVDEALGAVQKAMRDDDER